MANPLLGLIFHWIGGFSSASFYVPYKGVRQWSWEVYWITGGVVSWIFAPWVFAFLLTEDLIGVLWSMPTDVLFWVYIFGVAWGAGGLTFGLTLRYLGISLGMAVALGLTTAFGTLIPPIYDGSLWPLLQTLSGQIVLAGVAVTLIGIAMVGVAGRSKERELPEEERKAAVAEFNFSRGIGVAIFSGIMSACFAYGLAAGETINERTLEAGTSILNQGLPALCVILLGGFTTNFLWCAYLILKNRSAGEFVGRLSPADARDNELLRVAANTLRSNYLFCALAGIAWYLQFFFYTMGESQMGAYDFSSWTLHMASIIIFSTLWGFYFREWKGVSRKTLTLVVSGIATLVAATIIIGWANYITAVG